MSGKLLDSKHGLTDKEVLFCRAYARSLNQTRSYLEVFGTCSYEVAAVEGARILKKPRLKKYLGELLGVNEVSVMNALTAIAFADASDLESVLKIEHITKKDGSIHTITTLQPIEQWTDRAKMAIKSYKVDRYGNITIQFHDKLAALEKLIQKLSLVPQQAPIMVSIEQLAQAGLLVPKQAEVVSDGLQAIEDNLRTIAAESTPVAALNPVTESESHESQDETGEGESE